jgi:hypothetical protein
MTAMTRSGNWPEGSFDDSVLTPLWLDNPKRPAIYHYGRSIEARHYDRRETFEAQKAGGGVDDPGPNVSGQ